MMAHTLLKTNQILRISISVDSIIAYQHFLFNFRLLQTVN